MAQRYQRTEAGKAHIYRASATQEDTQSQLLRDLSERLFSGSAAQLAMHEESELRVVIGDLCPLPEVLGLLRRFFDSCPSTRLHLHFEAIAGPWERLFNGEADLIIHHIDKSDPRLEFIDLHGVKLVPVVAPSPI